MEPLFGLVTVTLAKTGAANDKTTQTREQVILITSAFDIRVACKMEYRQARGMVSHRVELNPGEDTSGESRKRILACHYTAFNRAFSV